MVPTKEDIYSILKIFKYSSIRSFLVTIKILKKDRGFLSFPIKGYTLAFDIPSGEKDQNLFNELNKILLKSQGKIYLTKDSLMDKNLFKLIYNKNLKIFKKKIRTKKNSKTFLSLQSKRLGI